jgi:hypothetical protein
VTCRRVANESSIPDAQHAGILRRVNDSTYAGIRHESTRNLELVKESC